MDDTGNRLVLWSVLVIAGLFVIAMLVLGNVAGWVLGTNRALAI